MKLSTRLKVIKAAIFDKSVIIISENRSIMDISTSDIGLYEIERRLDNAYLSIITNEQYKLAMIRLKRKILKGEKNDKV